MDVWSCRFFPWIRGVFLACIWKMMCYTRFIALPGIRYRDGEVDDDRWHRRCLSTRALIVFAHPPTRLARKQINTSITGIITWFEVLDRQREKKKNIAINPSLIIYYILCKVILRINWCIMHILIFLKIIDYSVNWMTCCIHIV